MASVSSLFRNSLKSHLFIKNFLGINQCCTAPNNVRYCLNTSRTLSTSTRALFPTSSHKLSPREANEILRHNETTIDVGASTASSTTVKTSDINPPPLYSILSVDSNQLAANYPIEDKLTAARCLHTTGFLFGVFDGHGGPECSQVVAKRLFDYIAAALLPKPRLNTILQQWRDGEEVLLTQTYHDESKFVPELQSIYTESLIKWCKKLAQENRPKAFSMREALRSAFLQLDDDMGEEVNESSRTVSEKTQEALLRVAVSGSVACVAHLDGQHLHVAHVGDCFALLGHKVSDEKDGSWSHERLTVNHDWENDKEIKRVLSEHPKSEAPNVIKNMRLLGALMPFRAFGDYRFKWTQQQQREILNIKPNTDALSKYVLTPPYLIAEPAVTYHRLKPHDRFLVIGSDGLSDHLSPLDTVTLVGEYMCGRQTLTPVQLPARPITLGEVAEMLDQRQDGLRLKPADTNAATHLIRHCVGSSETGLDHGSLAHSLTLAPEVRRYFRDDITIHVVFFDQEYLRFCPLQS